MRLNTTPKSRLGRWRMYGLLLTMPVMLAMYHPVQERLLRGQVLADQTVPYRELEQFAATYDDPLQAVKALWDTGWLPHRHFAVEWLFRQSVAYEGMRPYMVDCLREPDGDLRETAMLWLTANHSAENLPLLVPLVHDADPRVACYASVLIGRYGQRQHAGWLRYALEQPDDLTKIRAFGAFQRWSGYDDGVSLGSTAQDIEIAEKHWRTWLAQQPDLLQPASEQPLAIASQVAMKPDLHDATGAPLDLPDWGKRPLLLVFWSARDVNSLDNLSCMGQLALNRQCTIPIVTVCVDDLPARHVGSDHNLEASSSTTAPAPALSWPHLEAYTTVDTLVAYRAHDIPITVLIDSQGRIQRRLDYVRSPDGLLAMIASLNESPELTVADKRDK